MATQVVCDSCGLPTDLSDGDSLKIEMKYTTWPTDEVGGPGHRFSRALHSSFDLCLACRRKLMPVFERLVRDFILHATPSMLGESVTKPGGPVPTGDCTFLIYNPVKFESRDRLVDLGRAIPGNQSFSEFFSQDRLLLFKAAEDNGDQRLEARLPTD